MLTVTLLLAAQAAAATPRVAAPPSCAERWKAAHGGPPTDHQSAAFKAYQRDAKAFGQTCVFNATGSGPSMTRADVLAAAARHLDASASFVGTPPTDVVAFCSRYAAMPADQRVTFWRTLFGAIALEESAYKNGSLMLDYPEYSIGLYQVSIHNGCAVKTEAELGDPEKNTMCAVSIMSRLATPGAAADGHQRPGILGGDPDHLKLGAAHYWSTLRSTSGARARIIAAASRALGCASASH